MRLKKRIVDQIKLQELHTVHSNKTQVGSMISE